ncbi:alginate O-acetyltransferase AlgX-related protein [Actinophytocola sp.]|uniref:alginate O-acetyltransferase AlgX-related protein n=1 Tax=Actinophytocola sp. TaxID=1872138 RepID=UPI003899C089
MTAGPTNELPPVHEAWLPREHSLHRPRHGKRQLTALVSALVFFATPALMWVFGARADEIENHKLAAFPSITDGWGLFTGLDDWATDNLPFRGGAVDATEWISETFFGEPAPFDQGGGGTPTGPLPGSPAEEEPRQDQTDPTEGETDGTGQAGFRQVVNGTDGWMYYGSDAQSKCRPLQPLHQTITQLARLRHVVESSGRTFVLVLVPDKTTMVPEYLPVSYPGKDCAAPVTPQLWQQAVGLAGAVDMRPRLQAAADRYGKPVYYPQDTHWTSEGAIEMLRTIADEIRPGATKTWKVQRKDTSTVQADLPPLIGKKGQNQVVNYRLRPDGRYDRVRKNTTDLLNPRHITSKQLKGMIDQPTAVLGDSFLVGASGYLPAAFSDVTVQYYRGAENRPDDAVRTITDSEVVVLEVVERNVAAGAVAVLDQGFLDKLDQQLVKHPIR